MSTKDNKSVTIATLSRDLRLARLVAGNAKSEEQHQVEAQTWLKYLTERLNKTEHEKALSLF